MRDDCFIDSSVIIYSVDQNSAKKEIALNILETGAVVSTQVINEITNVMVKKLKFTYSDVMNINNRFWSIADWLSSV